MHSENTSAAQVIHPFTPSTPILASLELTPELRYILGLPHSKLINTAQLLRQLGYCIGPRSEDEQAAVIHWMLEHYLRRGEHWKVFAYLELDADSAFPGFPGDES